MRVEFSLCSCNRVTSLPAARHVLLAAHASKYTRGGHGTALAEYTMLTRTRPSQPDPTDPNNCNLLLNSWREHYGLYFTSTRRKSTTRRRRSQLWQRFFSNFKQQRQHQQRPLCSLSDHRTRLFSNHAVMTVAIMMDCHRRRLCGVFRSCGGSRTDIATESNFSRNE